MNQYSTAARFSEAEFLAINAYCSNKGMKPSQLLRIILSWALSHWLLIPRNLKAQTPKKAEKLLGAKITLQMKLDINALCTYYRISKSQLIRLATKAYLAQAGVTLDQFKPRVSATVEHPILPHLNPFLQRPPLPKTAKNKTLVGQFLHQQQQSRYNAYQAGEVFGLAAYLLLTCSRRA